MVIQANLRAYWRVSVMGNILSLDQAKTTGFAIFSPTTELILHGAKTLDYAQQYDFFSSLLVKYDITTLIIEDIQLQRNVSTFKILAQLQGIFIALAHNHNLDLHVISPNTWRSKVGLQGRNRTQLKHNAVAMVQDLYNIKTNQDTSEAVLIGHSYLLDNQSAFKKRKGYCSSPFLYVVTGYLTPSFSRRSLHLLALALLAARGALRTD